MDIIVNRQGVSRRTASFFTHGLGAAPAKKSDVQAKAQSVLNLILSLQSDVKKYNAELKKVNPWWAANFETRLREFYTFRDGINSLAEGAADLQVADNTLDQMKVDYEALAKTLASVKPSDKPPPPKPDPEGTSPLIYVAIGLGVLAVVALASGSDQ